MVTALASGLGLLPMAIVILFGLDTSTILNMFVVPALMLRFGSVAARRA